MTNKVELIKLIELKLHKKASELVPEMNVDEWGDFKKNIKKHGVRQPIHINMKNEILDGRHRFLACRDLGIKEIQAMRHNLTEQEEMEFVRDTAIERRNLTVAQKHKIVTDADELIKSIYEEGRKKQLSELKHQKPSLDSAEPNDNKPHNTNEEIGKLIGASKATAQRLNKIKKEAPDKYEEVVAGEKTVRGAYDELPTVKKTESKPRVERGVADVKVKKKEASGKLYSFKNEEVSGKEMEELLLNSKNLTLKGHLNQLKMFMETTDNLEEVISLNESDEDEFIEYAKSLDVLQNAIIKKYGSVTK